MLDTSSKRGLSFSTHHVKDKLLRIFSERAAHRVHQRSKAAHHCRAHARKHRGRRFLRDGRRFLLGRGVGAVQSADEEVEYQTRLVALEKGSETRMGTKRGIQSTKRIESGDS